MSAPGEDDAESAPDDPDDSTELQDSSESGATRKSAAGPDAGDSGDEGGAAACDDDRETEDPEDDERETEDDDGDGDDGDDEERDDAEDDPYPFDPDNPGAGLVASSWVDKVIRFALVQKLVVAIFVVVAIAWGLMAAPFDWDLGGWVERDPVPVDAIPDIGENQQIVFTPWMGRSPQDVEDQITYPLTVNLLGIPGVKTIRSMSFFGFSSIYVIFDEEVEFYWSRSRILEKLQSLPQGTLPDEVRPQLGPDATALGQVFWYTLEGRDPEGRPTGGWDLDELRTVQDFTVRYALQGAKGVSEVASVGGYVREYQVEVDPDKMRAYGLGLEDVWSAVKKSNVDVGARTIEIASAEYVVRGVGFLKSVEDLERSVVAVRESVPILVKDLAHVRLGPALRRGALDKGGAEAVGGVVVVRFGDNPLATIKRVKAKIAEIQAGLPKRTLADGTVSQVTVVPFYDRTGLIQETLGTLESALTEEILISLVVVLLLLVHLRSSLLISGLLPLSVLLCFVAMKQFGVDANVVALSGIAIAIGTMVDMGIVLCENIVQGLEEAPPGKPRLHTIYESATEVGGAVVTAVATTVVSFLPVFAMEAAEGKLFTPLAWTKTFALTASVLVSLVVIPPFAHLLFTKRRGVDVGAIIRALVLLVVAAAAAWWITWWVGALVLGFAAYRLAEPRLPEGLTTVVAWGLSFGVAGYLVYVLAGHWAPLGPTAPLVENLIFTGVLVGGLLLTFRLFQTIYRPLLIAFLHVKVLFLALPVMLVVFGLTIWLGFQTVFAPIPWAAERAGLARAPIEGSAPWVTLRHAFPGLKKEFMPPLDEGSFLYMPTTMPHASIGEALDVLQKLDLSIQAIPEVESVVGKIGRADSSLDPAPVSMIESVIVYKPEYRVDPDGTRVRQWRPEIRSPDDIWKAIQAAAKIPGTTPAPPLQPIAARLVMLQSGMRAPMGVKIKGPDLATIERFGLELERLLKEVPQVEADMVQADRIVGKPYLEIVIDRDAASRYGIYVRGIQDVIETAIGGKVVTQTVEGRERYPVLVRYPRELRSDLDSLERVLVSAPGGAQIPLTQLAEIRYTPGPQVIKSEDTFLTGYVLFDKREEAGEVETVEAAKAFLEAQVASGALAVPEGVSFTFAGNYENQVRSEKKLRVVLPLALLLIFVILYLSFRSAAVTGFVFSGIAVAWAGGFIMIWLYGQPWFLDFAVFDVNMRTLFQAHPMKLSVAIWVGFLALFGIATDDGVVMTTYLQETFRKRQPKTRAEIRAAVVEAGGRRIRPCLMTTATTILALIPVLTSTGRGSDIMVPMAIPSFGGMLIALITLFVVPVLFCMREELRLTFRRSKAESA